jgi:four helix bundle protein
MTTNSTFKDLRIWQEAIGLTLEIYQVTASFPKHEIYGLSSQMRRAAVSVPSNIAEGKGHSSDREFVHFLLHARGSLLELPDASFDSSTVTIHVRGSSERAL